MNNYPKVLALALALAFSSCEPEQVVTEVTIVQGEGTITNDDTDVAETVPFKTSGFIVSSLTQSSAGFSYFAGYFEDKPAGNLDLTQYNSFTGYYPEYVYKNFAYGRPLDNDNFELNRYAVNNETGAVVEAGSIQLTTFLSEVLVINDDIGIYTVLDTPKLFVFNPMTMEFIQEIDLSMGTQIEDFPDQTNSYFHLIYREQDNKVFLPLQTDSPVTPYFYSANDIYVEVVDMNTMTWEKTAVFEGATYPLTRGMENPVVDEQGNIYITTQGQYSLDGQAGPTAAAASRPQILKIPAGGTDFDPNYAFNPVDYLGFNFLVAQFVTGTIYGKDGIAYAAISAKVDDPRILELLGELAAGTLTEQGLNELRDLVINGANSQWAKIDLNAQTAEVIADIPFTAGFGYPFSYKYDDKMYFQVFDPATGANGYYEYDPATTKSFNIYNVSSGGIATQLVKLQE